MAHSLEKHGSNRDTWTRVHLMTPSKGEKSSRVESGLLRRSRTWNSHTSTGLMCSSRATKQQRQANLTAANNTITKAGNKIRPRSPTRRAFVRSSLNADWVGLFQFGTSNKVQCLHRVGLLNRLCSCEWESNRSRAYLSPQSRC